MKRLLLFLAAFALSAAAGFAQTTADGAGNSFLAALETVGSRQIYVYLSVSYADSAVAEDYVDASVLRSDVSAAVQGVSNKSAPLEVYAAAALSAVYAKYPQMQVVNIQILYLPQTLNQQTVQAQRTRPAPAKTASSKK